jgi:hypothetical protein
MAKPVPKGAHVILIQRKAHASTLATRKGKLRAGTSKNDALRALLRLAKTGRDTAVVVDGKGRVILSAKGGKRGGKTKTSANIAKIAATTTGRVQLMRRPADGAVVRSKSATSFAISSWKSMPRGSYLNVLGANRRFFGPLKGGAARKTSKKTSRR